MLEPFCPMKHDLYITNIHVSYRDTVCIGMFPILTFIQIYKILCRIITTNNNFTFSYNILIVQPTFSRINSADLLLKFQQN